MKTLSLTRVGLAVATIAMAATLLLTYRALRQSEISNAWVDHTRQTLSALVALEGAIADSIFADDGAPANRTAAIVSDRLNALATLTADDPDQQDHLQRLRNEIGNLTRLRQVNAAVSAPTGGRPPIVSASLSRAIRDVREEELRLLNVRVGTNEQTAGRLRSVLVGVMLGAALLLASVFALVARDELHTKTTHRLLSDANETLERRVRERTEKLAETVERELGLREQAEASNRSKDEFLMMVSHELRTPLSPLLGWADMLRLGILSASDRDRAVNSIYENAKLQKQLIADLLDTARILTGKLELVPASVDLGSLVERAVDVVRLAAEAKGLDLEISIDDGARPFVGDATRLQQIVWNLVSNAVKFTAKGKVSVSLKEVGAEVMLTVVDTGVGIRQDFLPQAFDRFVQEKAGTTRPHGGLGLGLAIVKHLAELHGGTVRAESDGEGCGATFTVVLPVIQDLKLRAKALVVETRLPVLAGVRVLVADDDNSLRQVVSAALGLCGAQVTCVASAAEARAAAVRRPPDVMLLDIAMPGEDGYALIGELRRRGFRQPIAALTAQARAEDRARALALGFDLHISKPIEASDLAHIVADLASRSVA